MTQQQMAVGLVGLAVALPLLGLALLVVRDKRALDRRLRAVQLDREDREHRQLQARFRLRTCAPSSTKRASL